MFLINHLEGVTDLSKKKERKMVFIFIDTDRHVSPFDTLLTIDLFPEAKILHYPGVKESDISQLVSDSMFPRGPSGTKYTKIFLGGSDVETVRKVLKIIKKTMFPPFQVAVIVDPRGAYTTASAAVAKTISFLIDPAFHDLGGKTVTVLAGTGPVGQAAAYLYASENADVRITSRSKERAQVISHVINLELGSELILGVRANDDESFGRAIEGADIILSTGKQGIQLLSLGTLEKHGSRCKVVADVNAVPPTGIEGLKPTNKGEEIINGVKGIGALSIGSLKNKVEAELLRQVVEAKNGIFDHKAAYNIAKSMTPKTD
jgi:methylene-tetrahydromethanopterin dehydrogenase